MDDNLYDEFGNYIGPELGSEDGSDVVRVCGRVVSKRVTKLPSSLATCRGLILASVLSW
jgi:hypothetical protein